MPKIDRSFENGKWIFNGRSKNMLEVENGIKIGNNSDEAPIAGSGSIRYNEGFVEYSNGITWSSLGGGSFSMGPQGYQGPQGPQGSVGLTGSQGPQGDQGPIGPQGFQGITGPNNGTLIDGDYQLITSTYSVLNTDEVVECGVNSFDVNLYSCSGNSKRILVVNNQGPGLISVKPDINDLINGTSSFVLYPYDSITIFSNGNNWLII